MRLTAMEANIRSIFARRTVEQKKDLYCCYRATGGIYFDYSTLAHSRRDSMAKLFEIRDQTWEMSKREGWKCIRVDLIILGREGGA